MMQVKCYRNLNRKGVVWSVVDKSTNLVVDRATTVYLSNCKFVVSDRGRERVRKEKRKNVHATVRGRRVKAVPKLDWVRVSYDPYVHQGFSTKTGKIITEAKYVKLTKTGCWASKG